MYWGTAILPSYATTVNAKRFQTSLSLKPSYYGKVSNIMNTY